MCQPTDVRSWEPEMGMREVKMTLRTEMYYNLCILGIDKAVAREMACLETIESEGPYLEVADAFYGFASWDKTPQGYAYWFAKMQEAVAKAEEERRDIALKTRNNAINSLIDKLSRLL